MTPIWFDASLVVLIAIFALSIWLLYYGTVVGRR